MGGSLGRASMAYDLHSQELAETTTSETCERVPLDIFTSRRGTFFAQGNVRPYAGDPFHPSRKLGKGGVLNHYTWSIKVYQIFKEQNLKMLRKLPVLSIRHPITAIASSSF